MCTTISLSPGYLSQKLSYLPLPSHKSQSGHFTGGGVPTLSSPAFNVSAPSSDMFIITDCDGDDVLTEVLPKPTLTTCPTVAALWIQLHGVNASVVDARRKANRKAIIDVSVDGIGRIIMKSKT